MGPNLGLFINLAKCELFSPTIKSSFPSVVKSSCLPNVDILGAPIGDYLFCAHFIAERCAQAKKLLSALLEMADSDLHVAISLLRICGGFCKLVHILRTTPPSLSSEALRAFDGETRSCFSACLAADVTDAAWQQAQLSLSFGGLGLRSLALHSSSAFLASFSASGVGNTNNLHLQQSPITFNSQVSHSDAVTIESVLADQPRRNSKLLSDGGWVWTLHLPQCAHFVQGLLSTPLVTMLCPVDMGVTQSSDTTNCVTSLQIYVARHTCLSGWKRDMVCVVTSITLIQLMSLWRVGREANLLP